MSFATSSDASCTLLVSYDGELALAKESDFMQQLEQKDEGIKIESLKCLIASVTSGESYPRLLMSVIKFCLHSEDHLLKKLLLLYWEVVQKKGKDGHLLHEMILVCNAMKNNLTHANEYIRGSTLRFLCKIKEAEILESLIPAVTANLEHRHSYVRKNAVLAVFHIFSAHADLIPDAPELIETFLYNESNSAAKRNAFQMLFHCDLERAVAFMHSVMPTVGTMGESFQLVVLELIRKVCRTNPASKGEYIRCIFALVNGPSHAVAFEGANTLVALSSAPTAVRAAIRAYCTLLAQESDNNIKLIILSKLLSLKPRHEKILQEMLMDILRTLDSPSIDIKRKTLDLALELLSSRNVEPVVQLLKKELIKTENNAMNPQENNLSAGSGAAANAPGVTMRSVSDAYRKVLMDAMHACAVKFPDVVSTVVHLLMNYLGDESASAAADVAAFVREIVHEYPSLRESLLTKVIESFADVRASEVYRTCIWILGEYAVEPAILELALTTLKANVGALPLLSKVPTVSGTEEWAKTKQQEDAAKVQMHDAAKVKKGPVVLADGTYASSSAAGSSSADSSRASASSSVLFPSNQSHLRTLLLGGDYLLGSVLCNAYAKLVLRFAGIVGVRSPEANEEIARALLFAVSMLKMGQSPLAAKSIDPDSLQRISILCKVLLEPEAGLAVMGSTIGAGSEVTSTAVFEAMLDDQRKKQPGKQDYGGKARTRAGAKKEQEKKKVELVRQADDLIVIRQLKGRGSADDDLLDDDNDAHDLTRALGGKVPSSASSALRSASSAAGPVSKLNRVYQLTGFSDPVYVESHLTVHDFDIVLDILVVNQTNGILQNLQVELHTSGDLKVVDRPQSYTIAPAGSGPNATGTGLQRIRSSIKLTSTESGVIFGNVVYDNASGTTKTIVVLNNIHLDVIDYISPATCSDVAFRSMWAEFEWENKVAVNTDLTDLAAYLQHVLAITNMKCMTPQNANSGSAAFLAANLYARSMFGEDALLNLSVEKQKTGKVGGYIRIRSKTQGIALSLGDKIQARQRTKA